MHYSMVLCSDCRALMGYRCRSNITTPVWCVECHPKILKEDIQKAKLSEKYQRELAAIGRGV